MRKKHILGVVGALLATTLIIFGSGMAIEQFAARPTEKRITVSRSYMEYWEYNNKPGTYKIRGDMTEVALTSIPRKIISI